MARASQRVSVYVVVAICCTILLFPLYWLVITALADPELLRQVPPPFWLSSPNWSIFWDLWTDRPIGEWMLNSLLVALGSVSLSMAVSVLAGYGLARFSVRGGQAMGIFILTSKMLPATLLVIPLFAIFSSIGLIGSLWSLVLAHSTLTIPFTTWMLKGYFETIPRELEQAAMVDGCSPFGALFRIILPVAGPGLAATALYSFVLSWSDYIYARTFLVNTPGKWTANVGVASIKGEYVIEWNVIFAASILVALPIVVIYIVLERYLVGGLSGVEK